MTVGGTADALRASAPHTFESAYLDGLMAFRRPLPTPVLNAAHGDGGALHGAAAIGLDHITTEAALATWADPVRCRCPAAQRFGCLVACSRSGQAPE